MKKALESELGFFPADARGFCNALISRTRILFYCGKLEGGLNFS